MATMKGRKLPPPSYYPHSDGRPLAETPQHRNNLAWVNEILQVWFAYDTMVYVSGNMFVYYVPGDRLRHVAPDVFVVRGVPRDKARRHYLTWEEEKAPDLVIELTSPSTKDEDLDDKVQIYRDTLKVKEYFLFDPNAEFLRPSLQGFRLQQGQYRRIRPVKGRLPSKVLSLHLEREGWLLRLYDPEMQQWLSTPPEERTARQRAEAAQEQAEAAQRQAEAARQQAEVARQQAEAEANRLRRELEALRGRMSGQD